MTAAEFTDPGIYQKIDRLAGDRQYAADHKAIEITGQCASCRDS